MRTHATTSNLPHSTRMPQHSAQAVAAALGYVAAFSAYVWKRPCPNLDDVSMNLSLTSSRALREVCGSSVRRRVMGRFLQPGTAPCRGLGLGRACWEQLGASTRCVDVGWELWGVMIHSALADW